MKKKVLIVTCEHAVNCIPKKYQSLFTPYVDLLNSHRGIDYGALEIALHFKKTMNCDVIAAPTSRLLIDYNRSLNNQCFSEMTKKLPKQIKQEIIEQFYLPYRDEVIKRIEQQMKQGHCVIHCSVHSFTPVLNQVIRNAEIGLLYEPQRASEKAFALSWKREISKQTDQYRIRMNYPYQGRSDGFTSALRRQYSIDEYIGIEIESNQSITRSNEALIQLKNILSKSLIKVLCAQ